MPRLLLFLAALFAAAGAYAQGQDWRRSVAVTPEGHYAVGNPKAKVTLVEFLSYTCPHCAHFVGEAKAPLIEGMVRGGSVRIEVRHAIRDQLDLAAALIARCAPPENFLPLSEAIFAGQAQWWTQGADFMRSNAARLSRYPASGQRRLVATAAGLKLLARAYGVDEARADACLTDDAQADRLAAISNASWSQIDGTPTFMVNGRKVETDSWSGLLPSLRAAGAS